MMAQRKFDEFRPVDHRNDKLVERTLPNSLAAAKQVEEEIVRKIEEGSYPKEAVFAIKLSLEEALTNAVRHGNNMDPNKYIIVKYTISEEEVVIEVEDQGPGFNPDNVPDPTSDENLERPSGRGIMLMRAFMNQVDYEGCGNRVRMVRFKHSQAI